MSKSSLRGGPKANAVVLLRLYHSPSTSRALNPKEAMKTMFKNCSAVLARKFLPIVLLPISVTGLSAVEPMIAAGMRHSIFLKSDGTAWVCGDNQHGQLGIGSFFNDQTIPIQIMSSVKAISGSEKHSLFLKSDGTVWATGANGGGQLGDGTVNSTSSLVQVSISEVKAVAAGGKFSVFLKTDGTVWACGYNEITGTTYDVLVPIQLAVSDVVAISAGYEHAIFLKSDHTAWGWGSNHKYPFGIAPNSLYSNPVQIASDVSAVSASGNQTDSVSLLLKTDGSVVASGSNTWGQLGNGTSGSTITVFSPVSISGVARIASHGLYSVFVKSDGTVWACGNNSSRQFGIGGNSYASPVQIQSGIMQVAAGYEHCLYLRNDGTVVAAGSNGDGQLGDGTLADRTSVVEIMSLGRFLHATATTGGTVTGGGAYEPGAVATVTATADFAYLFAGWDGDASGMENPLSVTMDSSKEIEAKFTRDMSDADGDGLGFYDEVITHGTNPALADTDDDGFDDHFEISTGFDPKSGTSTPDALSSIRTAVEFRFNAANGVSYRIEASTDLENWSTLESPISGTGGVVTRFYSTENQPRRYFRVRRN